MKLNIVLSVSVLVVGLFSGSAQDAWSAESCQAQIARKLAAETDAKLANRLLYFTYSYGYIDQRDVFTAAAGNSVSAALVNISGKLDRAREVFQQAAKGGGKTTEKLFRKIERMAKRQGVQLKKTYPEFIQFLQAGDRDGSLCKDGVPGRQALARISLQELD